jgi:hypothetical protein
MLKDICEFVKDKNIILVGNSVEIMEYDLKDYIESFDVVIHFGKAIGRNKRQEKSLGNRTDIWITGGFRAPMWYEYNSEFTKGKFKNTKIIFNRCRLHIDREPEPLPSFPYTMMFSDEELVDIFDEFGFGGDSDDISIKRPSAGFLTILFFIREVKSYKSLNLIGFDFFSKSTDRIRPGCKIKTPHSWHLPIYSTSESAHNVDIEQGYVKKLESENKLQWNILSNLSEEIIEYSNWLNNNSLDENSLKKIKEEG